MPSLKENFETLPVWKKRLIASSAVLVITIFALFSIDIIKKHIQSSSPQALKIKSSLQPIAENLQQAEKVGDRQAAQLLLSPITKILNDYNELDDAQKSKISSSKLKYCLLAANNLADGIIGVTTSGYWANKSQYDNAISECA